MRPPRGGPALALAAAALLAGCASGLRIDESYSARSQDSRVQHIVLHYTTGSFAGALKVLTEGRVSSHYLVRREPPSILRLVPEDRRAFHAGLSSWEGVNGINASSIGIEIDNAGFIDHAQGRYTPFDAAQIDQVIALVADIAKRHGVKPHRIVGHSDIAPTRKQDPGPLFPWQRLADAGLVPWPDAAQVEAARAAFEADGATLPDIAWFQSRLAQAGYAVPRHGQADAETRDVLVAFQMKYRPRLFNGRPDAETAALLQVITTPGGLLIADDQGRRQPYQR
ncbi:MAG: N-acetylmuramoyl-L-alanine amidase [Burkholderiaceae bacterium]|nr:N-acetylmuramoyl-L-alanine amidase [Burkholderiaceae bacterium]